MLVQNEDRWQVRVRVFVQKMSFYIIYHHVCIFFNQVVKKIEKGQEILLHNPHFDLSQCLCPKHDLAK